MQLGDIQTMFNRSFAYTFGRVKLLTIFTTLILCGLLVVFFRGLAIQAGEWITLSMTFLPIFVTIGVLLSVGIVMIRAYHDEVKGKPVSYIEILKKSWDVIIGASYFAIPIVLGYLILWMTLGIFVLLRMLPNVGDFFGVVLAFGPFLLNLGSLLLCIFSIAALFFLTPIIALKGFNRMLISQYLTKRLQQDLFSNTLLFIISILPFVLMLILLVISAQLSETLYDTSENPVYATLQWFFIMIPFTAFLTPTVIFFFNFAAESHVIFKISRDKD